MAPLELFSHISELYKTAAAQKKNMNEVFGRFVDSIGQIVPLDLSFQDLKEDRHRKRKEKAKHETTKRHKKKKKSKNRKSAKKAPKNVKESRYKNCLKEDDYKKAMKLLETSIAILAMNNEKAKSFARKMSKKLYFIIKLDAKYRLLNGEGKKGEENVDRPLKREEINAKISSLLKKAITRGDYLIPGYVGHERQDIENVLREGNLRERMYFIWKLSQDYLETQIFSNSKKLEWMKKASEKD